MAYWAGLVAIFLANALRDWSVPAVLVYTVGFYGAWAIGAAFALNPLGEEWPVLPMTLTSSIGGRTLVGGLWLAASLPGVLPGALATLAVAAASPPPGSTGSPWGERAVDDRLDSTLRPDVEHPVPPNI
ncbi:hypothetical protein BRC83_00830 [Halobacteriales archaeon QS_1_68_17]|nr:MAG: hypothetical protein BRC83_00830 [Halobacteriales archaeon QS_1_68_17]